MTRSEQLKKQLTQGYILLTINNQLSGSGCKQNGVFFRQIKTISAGRSISEYKMEVTKEILTAQKYLRSLKWETSNSLAAKLN